MGKKRKLVEYQSGSSVWLPWSTTNVPEYIWTGYNDEVPKFPPPKNYIFGSTERVGLSMPPPRKRSGNVSRTPPNTPGNRSTSRGRQASRSLSGTRSMSISRGRSTTRKTSKVRSRSLATRVSKGGAWNGQSTGYAGKFRTPTTGRAKANSVYARYGATTKYEWASLTQDPTCVYVGHGSFPIQKLTVTVLMALIRKMYAKANMYITNPTSIIPFSDLSVIQLYVKNIATGAETVFNSYGPIVGGYSLLQVADHFADQFAIIYSADANENLVLHSLQLYDNPAPQDVKARIFIQQCKVDLNCSSYMKIQNRTSSASGALEADDVDNQPIKGLCYFVDSLQPKYAGQSSFNFPLNADTGIITLTAGSNNALRDPFHPKMIGAKKASNVILNPGEVKSSKLTFKRSIGLDHLFKRLNLGPTTTTSTRVTLGQSQIFALEKIIGVGNTEVQVAYEAEFYISANISFKKAQPMVEYNWVSP